MCSILPPGAHYYLFAPKSTVVVGRHFYNFCCLHLTEVSCMYFRYKLHNGQPNTGPDPVAAWETLSRLLAMMPFIDKPRTLI